MTQAAATSPSQPSAPPPPACPPFSPGAMRWQIVRDTTLRWGIIVAVGFCFVISSYWGAVNTQAAGLLVLLAVGAWIGLGVVSARVWQQLPRISVLLDHDPASAEAMIALALRRLALQRSVRLMLYHRLAVLRHRQQRFPEAAAICAAVLAYPMGRGIAPGGNGGMDEAKAHLLLIMVESRLQTRDLAGAYHGLAQLHAMRLGLIESLQKLGLQLRYEVTAGHDAAALADLHRKIELAELMPGPQCGGVHAMLAFAARRAGQEDVYRWLRARAELLCTPEQLQAALSF